MATETPKQRRDRWFRTARGVLPSYKRPIGPPQPELTLADASKIYDAAGIPKSFIPYKNKIIQYMTEYSLTLDPTQRVPKDELIEQASSVCGRELQNNVTEIRPELTEDQQFVALYGLAMALTNGYKQQYETHFQIDPKTNEIIDLIHPHEQRQPLCDNFLKQKRDERARRKFAATGEPFDPYKGAQQGTARRRRKHSKKSKKTLRRK